MRKTESPELALCSLLGHEWSLGYNSTGHTRPHFVSLRCIICGIHHNYYLPLNFEGWYFSVRESMDDLIDWTIIRDSEVPDMVYEYINEQRLY